MKLIIAFIIFLKLGNNLIAFWIFYKLFNNMNRNNSFFMFDKGLD